MKKIRILIFVCITHYSFSQPFSEKTSNGFIFAGEENSAAAFVDVDNDGDEDLLHSSVFYKNNNEEGFSSFFTFVGASNVIAFADYNGDGFADILFGNTLYRNNAGTGFTAVFTFAGNTNAVSFADFNNDAQADIILTGSTSSILYRNNNGAFTQEQTLSGGTDIAHGDIDADGDLDVLILEERVYEYYKNNITGFSAYSLNIFPQTQAIPSTSNFVDFNNDGHTDIFANTQNVFSLFVNNGTAFTPLPFSHSLRNTHSSWADVDNNGFADLIISGQDPVSLQKTTALFVNNANTTFTEYTGFAGIESAQHALSDFDADGDVDIFLPEIGRFYENKTTVRNNPPNTPGALDASVLQDGTLQLSWSTVSDAETPSAGLHYEVYFSTHNPDNITFPNLILTKNQYMLSSFAAGVYYWSVRAVDPSGNSSPWSATQIYVTSKANAATNVTSTTFIANWEVNPNAVAYYLDVARDRNFTQFVLNNIAVSGTSRKVTQLTENTQYYYRVRTATPQGISNNSLSISVNTEQQIRINQTGSFTISTFPPFTLKNGSTHFADYDNDGDMDFFINGTTGNSTNTEFQRLQNSNAVLASPTSIANSYSHNTSYGDYNNDRRMDIYAHNAIFGDYNNDNTLDLFVAGKLYRNNANAFSPTAFTFPDIPNGSRNFVDFDNDGDRDIFITGYQSSSSQGITQLHRNNKTSFTEVFPLGIPNVENSASTFGDIDNDGDMDALISGYAVAHGRHTKLYENNNGTFTEKESFHGMENGSVSLVDLNNDGYLDVFATGITYEERPGVGNFETSLMGERVYDLPLYKDYYLDGNCSHGCDSAYVKTYPFYNAESKIYMSNKNKTFRDLGVLVTTSASNETIPSHYIDYSSNAAAADFEIKGACLWHYDNIYRPPSYTIEKTQIHGFLGSMDGRSFFGDYDNDGDKDIFVVGKLWVGKTQLPVLNHTSNQCTGNYPGGPNTYHVYYIGIKIYKNNGDSYTEVFSDILYNKRFKYDKFRTNSVNSGALGDYDNDGDLDFIAYSEINGQYYSKLYTNTSTIRNTPPTAPAELLSYSYGVGKAAFIWANGTDAQIPAENNRNLYAGLNYNMYMGTASNKNLIRSPQALTNGTLTLPQAGDLQGNIYKIENIPNGNYVWGMQSIDQGLMGSPLSPEQTIEITTKASTQSITFPALAEKGFLDAPFIPSATVTSGLPVSFLSTNTNVATVSTVNGRVITIVGQGETNIIAYQTGNTQYYGAYPVIQTLRVNRGKQVITFGNIPVQTVGIPLQFEVSTNSGLPISMYKNYGGDYSYYGNGWWYGGNHRYYRWEDIWNSIRQFLGIHSHGLASFSLSEVGTFTLTATQSEETLDFYAADPVSRTFIVKGYQSLTFFKIPEKIYGDAPFLLNGRNTAPLPITYSSAHTNITLQNNSVSIHGAGTVSITAFINETHLYYFPAHPVTQILTIKKARQSITFHPLSVRTFGHADSIVVLTPSASSSLPISLRVSGRSVVVNANTLTVKRAGVVLIEAFQSGNENYEAASTVKYLTIIDTTKRNQTIIFTPIPNDTLHSEGDSVRILLTATASSSLPLQFVAETSSDSLSAPSYTLRSSGIYTITALQDGDSVFNPAPPVSRTFTVKRKQSMIFSEIAQKNYESTPFFINAYTNAALNIEFSLSHDSIITLDPDYLVTIKNVGTVGITAKQRGNDEYYATDSITRILVVTKADQYFVFKPIPSKIYEDPPILLPATTNAGLNIMYSSSSNLINIKEDTLQIIAGGGLVRISAYNTGNKFYQPLAPVSRTFSISKAQQSIHFPQILNKIYGDSSLVFDSVSNKNLSITYTSSNPNILYIEKNTASILRAGSTTLSASVDETPQYLGVSQTQTVLISPAAQVVTFPAIPIVYVHEGTYVLNATSTNTLPILYASSDPNIASITGNTVVLHTFGNVSITASQPAVENYYYASNPETRLLTIKDRIAVENTITFPLEEIQYVGDTALLEATSSKNISVSFEIVNNRNGASQNISYFDKNSQKITFLDTGVFEIKAYTEAFLSREVKVNPAVFTKTIRVKIAYHISGRVLGAENEIVPGFVILTNPTLRETKRAELSNGYFSFRNVPSEWTFYLQAFPKGTTVTNYYPTYYGVKQAIVWTDADAIILTSHRSDLNWNLIKKQKSTISAGNGTIIGKVILDTTKNENRILGGNFFGSGVPYQYANIFLKSTADNVLLTDISRTNGGFYFTQLPAGSYRIAVDVPGTQMKNLNDTLFLPNEENILYITIVIGKDNTIEILQHIGKLNQTITFRPVYKYYGDEPFPIAATATSGLPLTFSSSSSLISIDRDIVTIRRTGTCIITAFQSGNEYYIPSDPTSQIMVVAKAYQSITIQTNIINDTYTFSERRVIIKATASSGLPVQMIPSEPTITNRGDTFFVRGIDIFKMEALQSGNENYHPEQIFQDIIIDPNAIIVENHFIKIFPNPADDYITIQWDKSQNVSSIRLYDVKGNEVSDGGLGIGYGVSIDIKTMPKGEYIVVVYGEKGEILKAEKVIKN